MSHWQIQLHMSKKWAYYLPFQTSLFLVSRNGPTIHLGTDSTTFSFLQHPDSPVSLTLPDASTLLISHSCFFTACSFSPSFLLLSLKQLFFTSPPPSGLSLLHIIGTHLPKSHVASSLRKALKCFTASGQSLQPSGWFAGVFRSWALPAPTSLLRCFPPLPQSLHASHSVCYFFSSPNMQSCCKPSHMLLHFSGALPWRIPTQVSRFNSSVPAPHLSDSQTIFLWVPTESQDVAALGLHFTAGHLFIWASVSPSSSHTWAFISISFISTPLRNICWIKF